MQYNRNQMNSLSNYNPFKEGAHRATIEEVKNGKSKSGKDMFQFDLVGENGEKGSSWLVFGEKWSDGTLQRILASVEDNNQKIPNSDFGYNQGTVNFLKGKRVFIEAKAKTGTYVDRNGEERQSTGTDIKNFLSREEFTMKGGATQAPTDPFAGGQPMNITDDDLPF
ncbi:single-stranded DNA-binding protein [Lactococcus sp.]|uniref:single-stranded DNA-binding protein n=1 Tax=Lactococcus sp. TaxID=44273 RepID=UPI0035AEDAE6